MNKEDFEKMSPESQEIITRGFTYTRNGCPLEAAHIIGDMVIHIEKLEKTIAK